MRWFFIMGFVTVGALAASAMPAVYEVTAVQDGGSITGRVTFKGTPPSDEKLVVSTENEVCGTEKPSRALLIGADGGIRNAVARVRRIERGKAWHPVEHTLGQTDCRFEPHVLLMNPGADLHILNTDRIAHNVRSYGRGPVFNIGHPRLVEKLIVENLAEQVSDPDVIRIGCDLHPWMNAYIVIKEHPYYSVTDENGSFRLTDVPPGKYDLEIWHETLGEKKRAVTVKPKEETVVLFEIGL